MDMPCAAKVCDTAFVIWRIPITEVIKLIAIIKIEKNTAN
jgi:hypothetical protein